MEDVIEQLTVLQRANKLIENDLAQIIHHSYPVSSGRDGLAVLTAAT